jgi:hypothetical protein
MKLENIIFPLKLIALADRSDGKMHCFGVASGDYTVLATVKPISLADGDVADAMRIANWMVHTLNAGSERRPPLE